MDRRTFVWIKWIGITLIMAILPKFVELHMSFDISFNHCLSAGLPRSCGAFSEAPCAKPPESCHWANGTFVRITDVRANNCQRLLRLEYRRSAEFDPSPYSPLSRPSGSRS